MSKNNILSKVSVDNLIVPNYFQSVKLAIRPFLEISNFIGELILGLMALIIFQMIDMAYQIFIQQD